MDFDSSLLQCEGYSDVANHHISVADFDNDGRDEVCLGAMTIGHNEQGFYSTRLQHAVGLHAGDLDPKRPSLELFGIHESEGRTIFLQTPGSAFFDGRT